MSAICTCRAPRLKKTPEGEPFCTACDGWHIPAKGSHTAGDPPPLNPHKAGPAKVGRNEPCPCESGRKFKKCCMGTTPQDKARAEAAAELARERRAEAMRWALTRGPACDIAKAKDAELERLKLIDQAAGPG